MTYSHWLLVIKHYLENWTIGDLEILYFSSNPTTALHSLPGGFRRKYAHRLR